MVSQFRFINYVQLLPISALNFLYAQYFVRLKTIVIFFLFYLIHFELAE